jgi:2-dehydropantoate 2-reductase
MSVTAAVLGPGAVGGALSVLLSLAGHEVTCVATPRAASAIEHDGLTLERCGEVLHARPGALVRLSDGVDVLFVTVRAPHLDSALERVRAAPGTTVPLLNGLEHLATIRARLDGDVVAGTVGRLEAYRTAPTRVVQTTPRPLATLGADGTASALLRDAGLEVRIEPNERLLLWEKVARLAPLAAATALAQRPVGELRADPDWRARLDAAIAEACAVAVAEGAPLVPAHQWAIIDAMPPDLTTSAARDVAAGRPNELDAITGAVVRAGRRLGVPTPALEQLFEEACRPQSR